MCASSCRTQDHKSWGECIRSQGQMIAYCNSAGGSDYTEQKRYDSSLDRYAAARAEGIQPSGTTTQAVNAAFAASDHLGKAFDAS